MGLIQRLAARMDRIADRDADPAALTGRFGSRRDALRIEVDQPGHRRSPRPDDDPAARSTPEDAPAQETEAQAALDRINADQRRRMRRRTFGGGDS